MSNYFVNEFLDVGLSNYFENRKDDIFERHVVECLIFIYGKDEIKRAYESHDEEALTKLIRMYELPLGIYSNLLGDMVSFENFKKRYREDVSLKTDIMDRIDSKLITMYKYKSAFKVQNVEDVNRFESLILRNFDIIKLRFNAAVDPNKTNELWTSEKNNILSTDNLVEVKPEYLDAFTYAKFGTSLEKVKQMDYRMVNELNKYIKSKEEENKITVTPEKKKPFSSPVWHTAISTGSGFVDILYIISIIATELSLGAIYVFLHLK